MLREDHICEYCDAEFTVESEVEDSVAFCPYCGSDIVDVENVFEYEDWGDDE